MGDDGRHGEHRERRGDQERAEGSGSSHGRLHGMSGRGRCGSRGDAAEDRHAVGGRERAEAAARRVSARRAGRGRERAALPPPADLFVEARKHLAWVELRAMIGELALDAIGKRVAERVDGFDDGLVLRVTVHHHRKRFREIGEERLDLGSSHAGILNRAYEKKKCRPRRRGRHLETSCGRYFGAAIDSGLSSSCRSSPACSCYRHRGRPRPRASANPSRS